MKAQMTRRSVLLGTLAGTSALALAACGNGGTSDSGGVATGTQDASTSANADDKSMTAGTLTTTIDLTQQGEGKVVRVRLPVAQDFEYQTIDQVDYDAPSATTASINQDEQGNQMLYLEWGEDADPTSRKATLTFHAERTEATRPDLIESGEIPGDIKQYLEGSRLVPVNDQVKDAADKIIGDKTAVLDKARAIYDWVIANMNRDENTEGCGQGDVCALLSTKSGKCTDINSVFIGLCRAVGVPARELFGVRMNADDVTTAQHCWAEFYLPGTGWVSADPADVLKAVLKNTWTKDQQETKDKAEYYWGTSTPSASSSPLAAMSP